MIQFFKSYLPVLFFALYFHSAHGQHGAVIEGVVTDAQSGETMPGATIALEGTTIGTTANLNGEFRLTNIPEGQVNLRVSFISYEPVVIEKIKVERGKTITLNVDLRTVSHILDAVTVTARRTNYTETSILQSIRNSQVVTSGISAQQISRSQDSDAAQVLRRIPGITIVEDKFIVIRGLNERYNVTMLHSMIAPSMEADVRSFSFDIIPSSQIENIMVFKSPSPELPGDFAGGVVKIHAKTIPEKSGLEFSYSTQYDQGTTFKNFKVSGRSPMAWTGAGKEFFMLPGDFPVDLRRITHDQNALQNAGHALTNNWVPEDKQAFLGQSAYLTGNLLFDRGSLRIGSITTFSYNNSNSSHQVSRADFNSYNREENLSLPIYRFQDARYSNSIKLGLLHNWGIEAGENHSFKIVNLFNNISSYNYINRTGDHIDFSYNMNNHAFQQVFRGLYSGQIIGEHYFFNKLTKLDYSGGLSFSYRDLPDYRQYRSDRPINYIEGLDNFEIYVPIGGAQPYFLGRFFSEMIERGNAWTVNLQQKIPLKFLSEDFLPQIKAGVFANYMERDFHARNIGYTQATSFDQRLRSMPVDSLFINGNINNNGGIKIDEQSNPNDSYYSSNNLLAWYGMLSIPFGKFANISGGVRVEYNRRILNSATTEGPIQLNNPETFLLPSFNATFNLTQKLLLRGAYGKTINNPEFREQAPFGFFDFDNNYVLTGNNFLKTATINNYDSRIEYYPSISEVVSVGAFYKQFENAIERIVLIGAGSGGAKNFSYGNADYASIYGAETELRKNFIGLTGLKFVDDLSIYFNASIIFSDVVIGSGSRSQNRDTDPRPLQGQSPYIVNLGLFYNNIERNLEVNVFYILNSRRLYSGGFTELDRPDVISYADIYEMQRNHVDITFSRRLSRNLSLKIKVDDILNEPFELIQDANQDGIFSRKNDQVLASYRPGTSFKVGLSYKF
jgi:hypothetical protein